MSRVQLFDHFGIKVAELDINASRTWKIGEYGRGVFELPVNHLKCTEENLQFGNLIYIDHPKLPPWGGVIDVPREWNRNTVTINAYSAEYILKFRRDDSINELTNTPGNIFNYIINVANRNGDTRIKKDYTLSEEESIAWELNLLDMYDEVTRLAEDTENEWILVPRVVDGELEFLAQWAKELGVETNFLLKEGFNIESGNAIISESGEIANDILGTGTGTTKANKPKVTTKDQTSIKNYGLRQTSLTINEKEYQAVAIATKAELSNKKNPQKTFSLVALDIGDTWKNINLGNKMYLQMRNVGFQHGALGLDTEIRITGMTYQEDENKLELNCEEIL
jgi:hypothetical protein